MFDEIRDRFPQDILDRPVWGPCAGKLVQGDTEKGVGTVGHPGCCWTFDEAAMLAAEWRCDGLAIRTGPKAGVWGADIDNKPDDDSLIRQLKGSVAIERSLSGNGFHAFGLINGHCPDAFGDTAGTEGVGMYSSDTRYLRLTGDWLNDRVVGPGDEAATLIGSYRASTGGTSTGLSKDVDILADHILPEHFMPVEVTVTGLKDEPLWTDPVNDRSEWMAELAKLLANAGASPDEIAATLLLKDETHVHLDKQGDPERALRRAVARGLARTKVGQGMVLNYQTKRAFALGTFSGPPAAVQEPPIPLSQKYRRWRGDQLTQLGVYDYTIEHMLGDTGFGEIWGASGSGKSFVIMDMGIHIAAGIPWCGYRTKQRPVIMFAAESGEAAVKRTKAWAIEHGPLPHD